MRRLSHRVSRRSLRDLLDQRARGGGLNQLLVTAASLVEEGRSPVTKPRQAEDSLFPTALDPVDPPDDPLPPGGVVFDARRVRRRSPARRTSRGPGHDLLHVDVRGTAYVDLARGAVVEDRGVQPLLGRGLLPFDDRLARGGKGRDVLTGTSQRDTLFGGGGRDVANGGAGVDLCLTEVRRNCEVR